MRSKCFTNQHSYIMYINVVQYSLNNDHKVSIYKQKKNYKENYIKGCGSYIRLMVIERAARFVCRFRIVGLE